MRNVISTYQESHLASLIPAIQPYIERAGRLLRPLAKALQRHRRPGRLRCRLRPHQRCRFSTAKPPNRWRQRGNQFHTEALLCFDVPQDGPIRLPLGYPWHAPATSVLLNVSESTDAMKKLLTPDNVSALTYEHLLAVSVTMSFTLSSLVYLVAMHPEVEAKLLGEIDSFGPKDVVPNTEELQIKFPYLEQVLKETMRFYTVIPLVAREASEEVEVGGHVLPKGAWVWLAHLVLAKDPKEFPDPDMFRPERFDPENEECKRRHPYAFIPFGIGPRTCIGEKFAIQQLKLIVIHLYRHYVFRHAPSMEFPLQFQYSIVVNFKHGVKLQVIESKT